HLRLSSRPSLELHSRQAIGCAGLVLVAESGGPAGLPARLRAAHPTGRHVHLHEWLAVAGGVIDAEPVRCRAAHSILEVGYVWGRALRPLPLELILGVVAVVLDLDRGRAGLSQTATSGRRGRAERWECRRRRGRGGRTIGIISRITPRRTAAVPAHA